MTSNQDGAQDLSDAVAIVTWLVLSHEAPAGAGAADTNPDGVPAMGVGVPFTVAQPGFSDRTARRCRSSL